MTYGHLQADCLYTGISSGHNARYRESFYLDLLRCQPRSFNLSLNYACQWNWYDITKRYIDI